MMPPPTDRQVANDLYDLTELLHNRGYDISGGFLGGEFGYGAHVDNDVFMMHPFCWCDMHDCAWCRSCECPEEAEVYEVAGERVTFEEWLAEYDRSKNRRRTYRKDPAYECDLCAGRIERAPNFLHKASGTRVSWYKYLGRGMELDVRAPWRALISECRVSVGGDA